MVAKMVDLIGASRSDVGGLSPLKLISHILFWTAVSYEDDTALFVTDNWTVAGEPGGASVVAELSDGKEAGGFHFGKEVLCAGYDGESRNIEDACVR